MAQNRSLSRSWYQVCMELCPEYYEQLSSQNLTNNTSQIQPDPMTKPTDYQKIFSIDLVKSSSSVLEFLKQLKKEPFQFDDQSFKRLIKQYAMFLLLQEKHFTSDLVPPLQIQAVWFTHMLQSNLYHEFITKWFPQASQVSHIVVQMLKADPTKRQEQETKQLWEAEFGGSYNPDKDPRIKKAIEELSKQLSPEILINDRDWINEFEIFTKGTEISKEWRQRAHLGYQKFLFLKQQNSFEVEQIAFSPCPSIDLMWHTHLLHPAQYRADVQRLIGQIPRHKLLDKKDRRLVFMKNRDDKQERMWKKEFGESLFDY